MSNSLWPHGLQYARLPCLATTSRTCSNSCPLSWWCHPTISSSVIPYSSCLQFFPASGSFPMSQIFPSGSQSIGVSASASVLPMNIEDWLPLDRLVWSPCIPRDSGRKYIFVFYGTSLYQPKQTNTVPMKISCQHLVKSMVLSGELKHLVEGFMLPGQMAIVKKSLTVSAKTVVGSWGLVTLPKTLLQGWSSKDYP